MDPVSQYIAQAAAARGIDPVTALRVFQTESGLNPSVHPGDGGSSFGVAQLHYGGVNPSMPRAGLGDSFTAATGLDARDPRTWQKQIDFALDNVSDHGWSDYATTRDKLGMGNFAGIGGRGANLALLTGAPQTDFLGKAATSPPIDDLGSLWVGPKAVTGVSNAPVDDLGSLWVGPQKPAQMHDILSAPAPDYLGQWNVGGGATAPSAAGEDLLGKWNVGSASQPAQAATPAAPPQSALTAPGGGLTFMNAMPIVGPGILRAGAAVNALASPYLGGGAPGSTFGDRYAGERSLQATEMAEFAAQHPEIATATSVAGSITGSLPMVMAAPALFGASATAPLWANALAGGASNAVVSAADAAARGGSPGDIGRAGVRGGVLGAAAPVVGAGVNALARGALGGVIPQDDAQLAALATQKYNIPLTAPQLSTSPGLKIASSTLNRLPFSGAGGDIAAQQAAFNQAVSGTIGESADKITPAVMLAAKARIGSYYDTVAQNTNINVDGKFLQDLHDVLNNASQVLPKAEAEPLVTQAQNIISKIDPNTKTISGATYQALTNTGAPLDRLAESENPNLAYYANGLKRALDGALERSAPPDQQALLQTADRQWAAMRTIQPIVAKSPTGDVSPALLAGRVNAATGNGMAFGYGGDLGELARIGQRFLKEPGSSNTAERAATMVTTGGIARNALAAVGAGSLVGLPNVSPMEAAAGMGAIPATLLFGRAMSTALRSKWLANSLINRSLNPSPPTLFPWLAGALAGSTGTNALSPSGGQ
jgi:hypothetical protein